MNEQQIFLQVDISLAVYRRSLSQLFHKVGVLANFAKFTRQHLSAFNFIEKETPAQVFSKFCKVFKKTFFTGELCATTSKYIFSK